MQGSVSAPANSSVYFVDGDVDVDVAAGSPLSVQGVWVLYATGNINIHNNIVAADGNSWAAFLSEKDIHLTPDAPNVLTLTGNFVANGTIVADPPVDPAHPRVNATINFTGGLVGMTAISVSGVYGPNTYTFQSISNSSLVLPNFTTILQRNILTGALNFK
jgi:hypothetical protein